MDTLSRDGDFASLVPLVHNPSIWGPGIVGPREAPVNSVKLDSSHFTSCTWQKKKCPPCGFSFCDGPL